MEINGRVNYPIKACLVAMQEQGDIDLDCSHQKFCISWFTMRVASVGTTLAIEAWNEHPISGTLNDATTINTPHPSYTFHSIASTFNLTRDIYTQVLAEGFQIN